jgi:hypothetical protein
MEIITVLLTQFAGLLSGCTDARPAWGAPPLFGRQFVIKAAFLKHPDDEPEFDPQPTFTMPYPTEDLIHTLDRQHHEEYESHIREPENHRREPENLHPNETV